MNILLTGFGAFKGIDINPSQVLVEKIAANEEFCRARDILPRVLPVSYASAENIIAELIRENKPEVVLSLGFSDSLIIRLERVALNLDDSSSPDNDSECRQERAIVEKGPAAYFSTLPLQRLLRAFRSRGYPVVISNHAGSYVCNHVFYAAMHQINQLGLNAMCGFIHVPRLWRPEGDSRYGLPLSVLAGALNCCLDILEDEVGQP